jgi:hypothetical protein
MWSKQPETCEPGQGVKTSHLRRERYVLFVWYSTRPMVVGGFLHIIRMEQHVHVCLLFVCVCEGTVAHGGSGFTTKVEATSLFCSSSVSCGL